MDVKKTFKKGKHHPTARARKVLSRPFSRIIKAGFANGKILDFGCGRGVDVMMGREKGYQIFGYDPYLPNSAPFTLEYFYKDLNEIKGNFETIICTYVLNVVFEDYEKKQILNDIYNLLVPQGSAFISVRDDIKKLKGWTGNTTWQQVVKLDAPVVFQEKGLFKTFLITKNS